jgi:hypothetical protein
VTEAIRRAHVHRFLWSRRQAADGDTSAAPIPDEEPPPYFPPPEVGAENDEPQQDAEMEGINHQGGDSGVPEDIDPAGVPTRRDKVD